MHFFLEEECYLKVFIIVNELRHHVAKSFIIDKSFSSSRFLSVTVDKIKMDTIESASNFYNLHICIYVSSIKIFFLVLDVYYRTAWEMIKRNKSPKLLTTTCHNSHFAHIKVCPDTSERILGGRTKLSLCSAVLYAVPDARFRIRS